VILVTGMTMRRREFISVFGGAAASSVLSPVAARAQQAAIPVIGFLAPNSAESDAYRAKAFRQGLNESGYVEGQNVGIDYRWADGHYDRLPAMAADLVQRRVTVIAATSTPAALAAKAATSTIPIVFEAATDPVKLGLVTSLNRPGGNLTGVTQLAEEVAPKRLELLHELLPAAHVMALLVNPTDPVLAEPQARQALSVAGTLGLELHVLTASTERDFDPLLR
jgi:putative ABC transport system substrate-binding protein